MPWKKKRNADMWWQQTKPSITKRENSKGQSQCADCKGKEKLTRIESALCQALVILDLIWSSWPSCMYICHIYIYKSIYTEQAFIYLEHFPPSLDILRMFAHQEHGALSVCPVFYHQCLVSRKHIVNKCLVSMWKWWLCHI